MNCLETLSFFVSIDIHLSLSHFVLVLDRSGRPEKSLATSGWEPSISPGDEPVSTDAALSPPLSPFPFLSLSN